jgi:hypothetical protein
MTGKKSGDAENCAGGSLVSLNAVTPQSAGAKFGSEVAPAPFLALHRR